MENSQAINIIQSRKLVATSGSYELKVTSVQPFEDKFIVNLGAMTPWHLQKAKELFKDGDIQGAVNQNISASLRATDYIPAKGEIVKVYIDQITTNKGVNGLFVTSLSELKAKAAGKVSFSFDEETVENLGTEMAASKAA